MKKLNMSALSLRIAAILACLVLFTTYMLSGMYARYSTTAKADAGARVARFAFTHGGSDHLELPLFMSPQENVKTYEFTVSNFDDNGTAEVALEYTISVSDFGNLPLSYELTCDGETVADDTSSSFSAATETEHKYVLTLIWDRSEAHYTYADEIDLVTVTVNAVQID